MAATDRLARAIIASDLAVMDSGSGHAAQLARMLAGRPRPATSLADLDAAPRWLRDGADARRALAHRTALANAAPMLARSIDGARLQALADLVGPDTLDHMIALGAAAPPNGAAIPDAESLEARGLALLAATLPPALAARLAARLDPSPSPAPPATADDARAAVTSALAAPQPVIPGLTQDPVACAQTGPA